MKRFLSVQLGFALVALVLAAACSTRPPEIKAQGSVPIALSAEQKTTSASVKLFNEIVLTLPPPKAPGYVWQIAFHDVRFLKQTTDIRLAATNGAGPTISFIAKNPGRTRLRFVLVPEGPARETRPVDQQDIILTIE